MGNDLSCGPWMACITSCLLYGYETREDRTRVKDGKDRDEYQVNVRSVSERKTVQLGTVKKNR